MDIKCKDKELLTTYFDLYFKTHQKDVRSAIE